jgi:hypothetical protein
VIRIKDNNLSAFSAIKKRVVSWLQLQNVYRWLIHFKLSAGWCPKEVLYANISAILHCHCRNEETEIHFKVRSHEIQVCLKYQQKQWETKIHISRTEAMHNHKFAWKYDWGYKMKALFIKKIYYSTGYEDANGETSNTQLLDWWWNSEDSMWCTFHSGLNLVEVSCSQIQGWTLGKGTREWVD